MKNNLKDMMCLDIYLNSLNDKERKKTGAQIQEKKHGYINLKSWGIASLFDSYDIVSVLNLAKDFNWKNNVRQILQENIYDALVITDNDKKIMWVNDGFTKMTNYPKEFAINKTPTFLQGKETTNESRKNIRKKLQLNKPFKEVIINYKKDKTSYKCEIHVFPLYNSQHKTTHFLALEKEIS